MRDLGIDEPTGAELKALSLAPAKLRETRRRCDAHLRSAVMYNHIDEFAGGIGIFRHIRVARYQGSGGATRKHGRQTMGAPMAEAEFARLIEDAALAPRQRLEEFRVGPNELPGPCFRRSVNRIDEMVMLRRKVRDPFLGVVLEDISRTIGPQRIGVYAESDEGESHLNQALTPNALQLI